METASRQNLFTRDDTFFGICQGLGEDLRINPDIFRVAMIPALFFFPMQTLAAYLGAGVVVFASRMVFPHPAAAPHIYEGVEATALDTPASDEKMALAA